MATFEHRIELGLQIDGVDTGDVIVQDVTVDAASKASSSG
jgi:hypothetical protein